MALRGKVAIITGSSSGIGAGIAIAFSKEGAKLSLTGRNQKNLEEVVKNCKKAGCQDVLTNVGDITQDAVRRTLVESTKKKFGKIDILVNNAGVSLGMFPLQSTTKELYDKTMAVNLEAPLFLTQLAAPHLIETKGNVINISTAGTGTITPGGGIYVMSKVALDTFTRYLAQELASKGVRVNAINPGFVPTPIIQSMTADKEQAAQLGKIMIKATPLGRACPPEEMGHIVAFLASEKAGFVTGECFRADGGFTMTTPALG
ncbi:uncharacterized oxidoreductase MexAM1_META1p0182-like [Haliotis rubra]|uniref:uncharacterized oxidoreductase MexAM1_META1p0182-like n=1 Tax=Haliotis rubra TaxID=36100 RepID=UPI001EE5D5F0|nr:uncharacterized oxidoreductase MexAM1_META1p0182-like [Haliotis rubra]